MLFLGWFLIPVRWMSNIKVRVGFTIACLSIGFFWLRAHPFFLKNLFEKSFHLPKKVLLVAFLFSVAQLFAQGLRFWFALPASISWSGSFKIYVLGQALNAFLPARMGDGFKVLALEKQKKGFLGSAKSVFVVDKFSDLLAFGLLLGSTLLYGVQRLLDQKLRWKLYGFLGVLGLLGVYSWGSGWLRRFLEGGSRNFKLSLSFALLEWSLECLGILSLCSVLSPSLAFHEAYWVLVILNLGIAVPVSVANMGTFETSMAFGLSRVGIPFSEGFLVAGVHHLIQWTAMGTTVLLVFMKDGWLSWRNFQRKK